VIEVSRPDVVVGRHTEADIRLPLPDVSRRHCRLMFVEGCWQVIDLHSLNGVYLNDEQVLQAPLVPGDLLRIGGFTFSVEIGHSWEPAVPPEPPPSGHVHSILKTLAQKPEEGPQRQAS
jgi:pSer/pThr/pTyr-binding forkhead associated (FHA) protein